VAVAVALDTRNLEDILKVMLEGMCRTAVSKSCHMPITQTPSRLSVVAPEVAPFSTNTVGGAAR
jgi:hypothetical protein